MYDKILNDFFKLESDKSDSERIQRAIDATPNGILNIDSNFLFPIYNGGTLILTTATTVILLKDKLKTKQIITVLIGIMGIVLMNL